ncbi:hypothetical protein QBZ16_000158 [Prototheca wickerhamii]|uniref:Telomere length regulation protein conserved domain-containing protein n=1 Tax=Prototheca wickerhamii TaxID=3111 RepID=A0AAD9IMS4_PROWI|nr:hypothetical protein QBZ16_000158 [Prototheca wickerhamii]
MRRTPALAQQLAGEFLERLASRGGTRLAGEALAEAAALINTQATALLVLPWVKDPRARHRVFAAALSSELGSSAPDLLSSVQHTSSSLLSCIDWPRLLLDPAAPLPPAALEAVVEHLAASTSLLPELSLRLAQAWSASGTEPGRRQSFLTLALIKCLRRLDPAEADADPMLPTLLRGVSAHLDSPLREVRLRGMRVGRAFSEVLALPKKEAAGSEGSGANEEAAPEILFTEDLPDQGWEDADEPYWQRAQSVRLVRDAAWSAKRRAAGEPVTSGAVDENGTEADLGPAEDDEDANDGGSSRQAFEAYDLDESDEEEAEVRKLSLREIIAGLSKGEAEWKLAARALKAAELVAQAQPDEFESQADRLGRALLHAKLPAWMGQEIGRPVDSLVATVAAAPEAAGTALAGELYSPSLDVHQRTMILGTLSASAMRLAGCEDRAAPPLMHQVQGEATPVPPASQRVRGDQPTTLGRTVWRADRALQALSEKPNERPNRFLPVALQWTRALLAGVDKQHHGIDLFGRDAFLLGRLLGTLGSFLEASAGSRESVGLAAAALEVAKARPVQEHAEPFVRRGAILAAAQAAAALPPAAVASALAAAAAPERGDPTLLGLLEWCAAWLERVGREDADDVCRGMAARGALELRGEARRNSLLEHGVLRMPAAGRGAGPIGLGSSEEPQILLPRPAAQAADIRIREVLPS